jgi:hypothetical protein
MASFEPVSLAAGVPLPATVTKPGVMSPLELAMESVKSAESIAASADTLAPSAITPSPDAITVADAPLTESTDPATATVTEVVKKEPLSPESLVWAKIKGFPWWPAKVRAFTWISNIYKCGAGFERGTHSV